MSRGHGQAWRGHSEVLASGRREDLGGRPGLRSTVSGNLSSSNPALGSLAIFQWFGFSVIGKTLRKELGGNGGLFRI